MPSSPTRLSSLILLLLTLSLSCQRTATAPEPTAEQAYLSVRLRTRQALTVDPLSVQLLLFADGHLEEYWNLGSALELLHVPIQPGAKTVYAVINGPSLTGVLEEEELKTTVLPLAEYNRLQEDTEGHFVSIGKAELPSPVSGEALTLELEAERRISRFVIHEVRNELSEAWGTIRLLGLFVVNGGEDLTLLNDAQAGSLHPGYNRMGRYQSEAIRDHCDAPEELLLKRLDETVQPGEALPLHVALYAYPHPSTGEEALRICLLAEIAGQPYYYPVTIPLPRSNCSYECSLSLLHLGSEDPNTEAQSSSLAVSLSVAPWDSATPIENTI